MLTTLFCRNSRTMPTEPADHVNSKTHTGSSSLPSVSTENEYHFDLEDCDSPQHSLSSPSSPTQTAESSSMATTPGRSSRTHRSRSGSRAQDTDAKKRKRSRVTPEQLAHLERFFAADRSPTAARRKEISELLGMQERQTQIWFQNR